MTKPPMKTQKTPSPCCAKCVSVHHLTYGRCKEANQCPCHTPSPVSAVCGVVFEEQRNPDGSLAYGEPCQNPLPCSVHPAPATTGEWAVEFRHKFQFKKIHPFIYDQMLGHIADLLSKREAQARVNE